MGMSNVSVSKLNLQFVSLKFFLQTSSFLTIAANHTSHLLLESNPSLTHPCKIITPLSYCKFTNQPTGFSFPFGVAQCGRQNDL